MANKRQRRELHRKQHQKMRQAKKPVIPSRWSQILNYRILSLEVVGWLGIVGVLLFIFALLYILVGYEYLETSTVESFTAEVDSVSSDRWGVYGEGGAIYWAKLVRDNDELNCGIPLTLISKISPERTYEFEVSRSRTRCVIIEAEDVTPFYFLDK